MYDFNAKVILCDIEGTTSSISFVKDILFPYATKNSQKYLKETWNTSATQAIVKDLMELEEYNAFRKKFSISQGPANLYTITEFVQYLISMDLKLGPLKELQGLVWSVGYGNGELKGHVYPDVPACFKNWQDSGIIIAIYSSGSIKAQKLLFESTEYGNLLQYINAHFDTTSGAKQEAKSYENIAKDLNTNVGDILFLTDIVKEAEAATLAGYQTVILARPGNGPLTDDDKTNFCIVNNFEELRINMK